MEWFNKRNEFETVEKSEAFRKEKDREAQKLTGEIRKDSEVRNAFNTKITSRMDERKEVFERIKQTQ